ncbi:hypothetical protein DOY81_008821, partial [Sarcophaga bullata]
YSNVKAMRILNAELADTLGNLLSRVCAKSLNPRQIYPRVHTAQLRDILTTDSGRHLWESLEQLSDKCTQHYEERNFYMAVDCVMSALHAANSFFETSRPWELKLKTITENTKRIMIPMPQCDSNALRLETIVAMTMDTLRVPWNQRLWANLKDHFVLVANGVREPPIEGCLSRADAVLFKRINPPDDDDYPQTKQQKQQAKKAKKTKVKKENKKVAQ